MRDFLNDPHSMDYGLQKMQMKLNVQKIKVYRKKTKVIDKQKAREMIIRDFKVGTGSKRDEQIKLYFNKSSNGND